MKHSREKSLRPKLHKDWRVWVAVGLMLAAMGMYVLTLDDSVQPEIAPGSANPPAAATAGPQR